MPSRPSASSPSSISFRRLLAPALALAAFAALATPGGAQELPVPTPGPGAGPEPWQQAIEYRIEARLDEDDQVLEGRSRVLYRNDSPDVIEDFYFHLYLNAFRPNSAWARRDLEAGITTFQELGPEEHAFERIREMTADGRPVAPFYPFAPDSTIVGFQLPEPLEPGASVTVEVRWDARTSTVPRRQGREGRQWDFAQWYPRVVVYDDEGWRVHPLYRAGEFFGEFATYDVTLDVAADQVVGATGVPVEGDPGWEDAAVLGTGPVDYQREWYGSLEGPPCIERAGQRICDRYPARNLRPDEPLGHLAPEVPEGRKRIRWFAENVHHFAWSTSPDYIYEQGRWEDVAIRVLYRPGDEETWGGGIAVRRTATALAWLDEIFGDYAYPQVTNLHRIEGGGTEFPMLIMDGSASQGLILHEVGHIYAHGILANNEWYEGWLDEGLSSFQTDWFFEEAGAGPDVYRGRQISTLLLELRGIAEPVVLPAEDYAEYGVYSAMIYTKGALVFWQLRELVGEDVFREILRTYYERYRFRHVDSEAFQSVAEDVSGRDLDWFFGPLLHTTGMVDYALDDVEVSRDGDTWITAFEVERKGGRIMPVPVRLTGEDGQVTDVTVDGTRREAEVAYRTDFRPVEVELDPDGAILDWNVRDNAWAAGIFSKPNVDRELDHPLRPLPTRWREIPLHLFPLAWFNDAGGYVAGLQLRSAQLGIAERGVTRVGLPAVEAGDKGGLARDTDWGSLYSKVENPILRGRPLFGTELELFAGEGRGLARFHTRRVEREPPLSGPPESVGLWGSIHWVVDDTYLRPGRWSPRDRFGAEVGLSAAYALGPDAFPVSFEHRAGGGFDTSDRGWLRYTVTADAAAEVADGWDVRLRAFVGLTTGRDREEGDWDLAAVPRERLFFAAGGDPFEAVSNPWARSAGAPLDEEGFVPGGGELRGFHPGVGFPRLGTLTAELATPEVETEAAGGWAARLVGFGGVGLGGPLLQPGTPWYDDAAAEELAEMDDWELLGSAGLGLEVGPTDSPYRIRFDVPLVVSEPLLATDATEETVGFRWTLGVTVGR